jgi:hypothetical protein
MEKIKNLLKVQDSEEVFALGSEDHAMVEKVRGLHINPSSVHNQHENFFGMALRFRQRLNN